MNTGRGRTLPGGITFFCVIRKRSSQAKIDGANGVESWVWSPHGRKYLSHGADVLLHSLFVYGLVVGCKDACEDLVRKYL